MFLNPQMQVSKNNSQYMCTYLLQLFFYVKGELIFVSNIFNIFNVLSIMSLRTQSKWAIALLLSCIASAWCCAHAVKYIRSTLEEQALVPEEHRKDAEWNKEELWATVQTFKVWECAAGEAGEEPT